MKILLREILLENKNFFLDHKIAIRKIKKLKQHKNTKNKNSKNTKNPLKINKDRQGKVNSELFGKQKLNQGTEEVFNYTKNAPERYAKFSLNKNKNNLLAT